MWSDHILVYFLPGNIKYFECPVSHAVSLPFNTNGYTNKILHKAWDDFNEGDLVPKVNGGSPLCEE